MKMIMLIILSWDNNFVYHNLLFNVMFKYANENISNSKYTHLQNINLKVMFKVFICWHVIVKGLIDFPFYQSELDLPRPGLEPGSCIKPGNSQSIRSHSFPV